MTDITDYDLEQIYRYDDDLNDVFDESVGTEDFMEQTQRFISLLARFFRRLFEFVKRHSNLLHARALVIKQRLLFLQDRLVNKNGLVGNDMVMKIRSNNDVFTVGSKSISKIIDLERYFIRYYQVISTMFDWISSDVPNIVRQINNLLSRSEMMDVDQLVSSIGTIVSTKGTAALSGKLQMTTQSNDKSISKPILGSIAVVINKSSKPVPPGFALTKIQLEEVPSAKNGSGVFTRFPVSNAKNLVAKLMDLCDRISEMHSSSLIRSRMRDYQSMIDKLESMGEAKARDNNDQGFNLIKYDQVIDQIKTVMVWGSKTQDTFSAHEIGRAHV